MDVENNGVMVDLIEAHRPSWWELMNPDGYFVYFRTTRRNARRASHLYRGITNLIVRDDRFSEFAIGQAEGDLISELDWLGRVRSPPMGGTAKQAMRNRVGRKHLAAYRDSPAADENDRR